MLLSGWSKNHGMGSSQHGMLKMNTNFDIIIFIDVAFFNFYSNVKLCKLFKF